MADVQVDGGFSDAPGDSGVVEDLGGGLEEADARLISEPSVLVAKLRLAVGHPTAVEQLRDRSRAALALDEREDQASCQPTGLPRFVKVSRAVDSTSSGIDSHA